MDYSTMMLLGAFGLAAAAAIYTFTESIKSLVSGWLYQRNPVGGDPWWWQGLWRLVPLCIGMAVGAVADATVEDFHSPEAAIVGTVAGVFCVVLYNKLKDFLIKMKIQDPRGPSSGA